MKIGYFFRLIRSLVPSLIFCFHYLPFRQAVKLPILVYKPHFLNLKGKLRIECDSIYCGMIRLGFLGAKAFPDTGVSWSNEGEIIFKGKCFIGANSFVVCGPQGRIEFGDDFRVGTSLHLVSMCGITFGLKTRIGWEAIIMDTNFHPLYDMEKQHFKRAFGPIKIGDYNWIGTRCLVMHSVETPERCIFAATTVVTRGGKYESYCVHGGNPVHVLTRNVIRKIGEDIITDYNL